MTSELLSKCIENKETDLATLLLKINMDENPEDKNNYNTLLKRLQDERDESTTTSGPVKEPGDSSNDGVHPEPKENPTCDIQQCVDSPVLPPPVNATQPFRRVDAEGYYRVMLLCNWMGSKQLCKLWDKMSKGYFTWNRIRIVWEEPCDFYVVINCPPIGFETPPEKTILFRMEPHMERDPLQWGYWANPERVFLFSGFHDEHYNNVEWHLSKTYSQLLKEPVEKTMDVRISAIFSGKYKDPGHVKRIDFAKYLENKGAPLDVFGSNKFSWKNYKGELPYHKKDDGLLPYKYTFNVENHEIKNYFTEKLIDGILSECLVFYSGCPNIKQYIDPRAFIHVDLGNFENAVRRISVCIQNDMWEKRIEYIRAEKKRILQQLQFFPRLEKIIEGTNKN